MERGHRTTQGVAIATRGSVGAMEGGLGANLGIVEAIDGSADTRKERVLQALLTNLI